MALPSADYYAYTQAAITLLKEGGLPQSVRDKVQAALEEVHGHAGVLIREEAKKVEAT